MGNQAFLFFEEDVIVLIEESTSGQRMGCTGWGEKKTMAVMVAGGDRISAFGPQLLSTVLMMDIFH